MRASIIVDQFLLSQLNFEGKIRNFRPTKHSLFNPILIAPALELVHRRKVMERSGGSGVPPNNNSGGDNSSSGDSCGSGGNNRDNENNGAVVNHDVFGDYNLGFVMLVLLLLHLMQYAMKDPFTC